MPLEPSQFAEVTWLTRVESCLEFALIHTIALS